MAQPPGYPAYPGVPASTDFGYPPPTGYAASAPGYPPATGYPPGYAPPAMYAPPTTGAYPPQAGYPPQSSAPGYPPAQPVAGYPPQSSSPYPQSASPYPQSASPYPQSSSPYPQAAPPAGYPPQTAPPAGYPPQTAPPAGYPPQSAPPAGYPPQTAPPAGYPQAAPPAGYPPQSAGYPPQTAPPAGYPPQTAPAYGYPPAGYPPQTTYLQTPGVPSPQFPQVQTPIVPQTAFSVQTTQGAGMYHMPRTDAGSVFPAPNFNVETDCETLRKAMKGIGTDEKAIIDVLAHRSNAQRQEILKKYKTMYGKDLIKELRSELTGSFEHTVVSLMLTFPEFRAKEMRDAMKGTGTDEIALIQVLCTSSNQMIRDTREAYKRLYSRELEKDLEKETSGHFKRLLIACANADRNESPTVDMTKAQNLAEQLYRAGAAKMGTDETGFLRVLANESYPQLQAVFDIYRQKYSVSIEDALKKEMSGDLLRGFLAIVRCVTNPPAYFAKTLYDAMSGAGTRDHELVRCVVMRCEVDMQLIKQEFQKTYGKTLSNVIVNDTSGDYKKVLVALVGP